MGAFFDPTAFLGLLLMLLSGGVRDLASCLSTDAYWKAKGVAVSFEQLSRDLEPIKPADVSKLIAELDADDPKARESATERIAAVGQAATAELEQAAKSPIPEVAARASGLLVRIRAGSKAAAVRRLMAIRTLGERKDADAIAVLKPLLNSHEMFEAEYAARAIAAIEGNAYQFPAATDAERAADVRILPARLDAAAQIAPTIDGGFTLEKIVNMFPSGAEQRAKALDETQSQVLKILEQAGNLRLDALTWGFYAAPPGKPGNSIAIVRGQFDFTALCTMFAKITRKATKVEGIDCFEFDDDFKILVTPDHRVVLLNREGGGELELETMTQAIRRGKGTFSTNADLAILLKGLDRKSPMWLAAKVSIGLKEVSGPLADFETVALSAKQSLDKTHLVTDLQLDGETSDANRTKDAAAKLKFLLQAVGAEGRREQEKSPYLKNLADLAESVKIVTEGGKATVTGTLRDMAIFPLGGAIRAQ